MRRLIKNSQQHKKVKNLGVNFVMIIECQIKIIKTHKNFLQLLKSSGMWVSSEIYSEVLSITNENYEKIIYCDSLHRERKN